MRLVAFGRSHRSLAMAGSSASARDNWRTPVDTGEEMAELCRTDGHDTVPVLPLAKHVIGELSASRRDPAQLRVIVMCPENTPAVAARAPGGPGTGAGTVGEERYPDARPAHERFLATAAMIIVR